MAISTFSTTPAMPLNILIIGAGVCGPALAFMLQKSNPKHTVTIIERFSSLRIGGQQIDLKEQGIPVVKKMGLLETLREQCVAEAGMDFVDTNGKKLMSFGINSSDPNTRKFALTNEFEFMRGDMVKIFHDASLEVRAEAENKGIREGGLKYEFGKTVTELSQTEKATTVTFSDGETKQFDLIVAADGQASRTRRLAFGEEISNASFKPLGRQAAYYSIPRLEREDALAKIYFAPGGRMVMTRTGNRPLTQVYFFVMNDEERSERIKSTYKQPVERQKKEWKSIYRDAGWECERLIEGMKDTNNFYACEIGQVKMTQLYKGRVALLGDAGYCPSAFTGMGTTLSLIGAYVLAGELARNGNNVKESLEAYNRIMREPIDQCQMLGPGVEGGFYPSSKLGISIVNNIIWTISCLKIDRLLAWAVNFLTQGKGRWPLPEYPELEAGQ